MKIKHVLTIISQTKMETVEYKFGLPVSREHKDVLASVCPYKSNISNVTACTAAIKRRHFPAVCTHFCTKLHLA